MLPVTAYLPSIIYLHLISGVSEKKLPGHSEKERSASVYSQYYYRYKNTLGELPKQGYKAASNSPGCLSLPVTAYLPSIIYLHLISGVGFLQTVLVWGMGLLIYDILKIYLK